jgi:arylsulfatase A-like enzyme
MSGMNRILRIFPLIGLLCAGLTHAAPRPNFVIIFTDDQGYGDLGCFGSTTIRTPHLDQIAAEGRKFTSFLVASSVCSPSRAALLTGSYPKRVGLENHVLFPNSTKGLHPSEYTIADHLKTLGYATACFGKWHLGHHPETLPTRQGFDTYFGIPYSNDMNHPDNSGKPQTSPDDLWKDPGSSLTQWHTPLVEDEAIIELPVDQRTVTRRYTDKAIKFITAHRDSPFFVYLPHSMPHYPLYVPDEVRDPDPAHAYTSVIEHLDAEVGRLMETIRSSPGATNTYVIFTSDNGPSLHYKNHGGSAGPLRDGKATSFEGGQRVPCLMWGPGIPAGTACDDLLTTMDLLPSIAHLTGSDLPDENKIDGLDVSGAILGTGPSPRKDFLYYSAYGVLEGIRQGDWKMLAKRPRKKGEPVDLSIEPTIFLFDLANDLGEQDNLASAHPDMVAAMLAEMNAQDAEIAANIRPTWSK